MGAGAGDSMTPRGRIKEDLLRPETGPVSGLRSSWRPLTQGPDTGQPGMWEVTFLVKPEPSGTDRNLQPHLPRGLLPTCLC